MKNKCKLLISFGGVGGILLICCVIVGLFGGGAEPPRVPTEITLPPTSTPTIVPPTSTAVPYTPTPVVPTPSKPTSTSRAQYAKTMLDQLDRLTEVNELVERTADLYSENKIDYADVERMMSTGSDSLDSQIAILSSMTPPPEWAELHGQSLLMYQTYRDAIQIALEVSQNRQGNPFGTMFNDKLNDAVREIDRTLLLMEEYEVIR